MQRVKFIIIAILIDAMVLFRCRLISNLVLK